MYRKISELLAILALTLVVVSCVTRDEESADKQDTRQWLAGDHHIHSRYSVGWKTDTDPPTAQIGGDAIYPIPMNAIMGQYYGLAWMVSTDHGGPNHSKVNLELAYPELVQSRRAVSQVIQFYGMELDTPAGEHSSLIIPHTHDEADVLHQLEAGFNTAEAWPVDPARDTEEKMLEALSAMSELDAPPVVIANHPSRTATGDGVWGAYHPAELRRWNDTAPAVAVGMAGAPGHQALALTTHPAATDKSKLVRGGYGGFPTMGGYDQMTAKLGGFWDSMLGEGRRWWITVNSDSHIHFSEKGYDFWPGEYSKTYVFADKNHDSILSGLRSGHVFVTTGDLISELYVEVLQGQKSASIGDELGVSAGSEITVNIRLKDPDTVNAGGQNPAVKRVDLIVGEVMGAAADANVDTNETTHVEHRYTASQWRKDGEYLTMSRTLRVTKPLYVRVRGTNTGEPEPLADPPAENPWDDLWFYSNPVFVTVQ